MILRFHVSNTPIFPNVFNFVTGFHDEDPNNEMFCLSRDAKARAMCFNVSGVGVGVVSFPEDAVGPTLIHGRELPDESDHFLFCDDAEEYRRFCMDYEQVTRLLTCLLMNGWGLDSGPQELFDLVKKTSGVLCEIFNGFCPECSHIQSIVQIFERSLVQAMKLTGQP